MKLIKTNNENSLINQFILMLKKEIIKKKKQKKRLSLVISGGKSPRNLFKKLAYTKIDWKIIDIFWGDERYVSSNSKDSNYKLALELFLKKIRINKKNLYPIKTNYKNIYICCKTYEKKINEYFNFKDINFDIFLIGMGKDGHILSLFPKSNILKKKFVVKSVARKDFKRITMSLKIINNSKKICLWLNSKDKSEKYKELKTFGNKIPVNNLKKSKLNVFKIN